MFDLNRLVSKGGTIGHQIYISQDLEVVYKNKVVGKLMLDVNPVYLTATDLKKHSVYGRAPLADKSIYIVGNNNFPAYYDYRAVDTIIEALRCHINRILGTES